MTEATNQILAAIGELATGLANARAKADGPGGVRLSDFHLDARPRRVEAEPHPPT